jgi:hypothetical protein
MSSASIDHVAGQGSSCWGVRGTNAQVLIMGSDLDTLFFGTCSDQRAASGRRRTACGLPVD